VVADEGEAIVVDVGGVGYEVFAPLGAAGRARTDDAGRATFYVHTHVREESLALYGFPTDEDRGAFRQLLGVSNVGPKTALAVMSALPAGELARAVTAKDMKALTSVPGIGRKTAEMMLVQLRDKVLAPPPHAALANGAAPGRAQGQNADMVASALVGLGYRPSDADRAIAALGERVDQAALQDLIREALAVLSK